MPDQTISDLFQRAVVWAALGNDAYGGTKVDIPDEIAVRWKWTKTNMQDPKRGTITVDAVVRVAVDVPIDSLIWLGSLKDFAGTAGPQLQTPEGLCQVKTFNFTPDIDNRFKSRTLGVIRYKGPLPPVPGRG